MCLRNKKQTGAQSCAYLRDVFDLLFLLFVFLLVSPRQGNFLVGFDASLVMLLFHVLCGFWSASAKKFLCFVIHSVSALIWIIPAAVVKRLRT
jgi:hypothetical protein